MRFIAICVLVAILFAISWPVAIAVLLLLPLLWLLALPFRIVGLCVEAVFALLKVILFLPARLLGHR